MRDNREAVCEIDTLGNDRPVESFLGDALERATFHHLLLPFPTTGEAYRRVLLNRDARLELAAARWADAGESTLHGHGESAAMYRILTGVVREERYVPEGDSYRYEVHLLRSGDVTYLPPGSFHRLSAVESAVTLHAYSPAPVDHVASVPAATRRKLEEARQQATHEGSVKLRPLSRRKQNLVTIIEELVEDWAEREARANRDGQLSMPAETIEEMRSSGLLAAPMPEQLGGWGSSLAETAEAIRQLGRHAPATALALVMPLGNAATTCIPLSAVPPARRTDLIQGQQWIADRVREGKILAVANSEPGAGGDLSNTKTRAERDEDSIIRLTGRKSFATFGRDADYFLCAARTSDTLPDRNSVVDGFFVERSAPGLTIDDRWNPVGMRPTASVGLTLESTPAEALLGYPGCLEGVNARHWSTVLFTAVFVGVGEGALQQGIQHAGPTACWSRATLAEHTLTLDAAAAFLLTVARDERWPLPSEAQERTRRAKTFAARAAVETSTSVAMIAGGRSYTPDHPVFRFLCDALAGPLLRPPLPQAMDSMIGQLFSTEEAMVRAA